jgi:hypothetical protein
VHWTQLCYYYLFWGIFSPGPLSRYKLSDTGHFYRSKYQCHFDAISRFPGAGRGYTGTIFSNIDYTKFIHQKFRIMSGLLYIIAVILVIGWAIGVFAYSATGLIHVLLVIAVVAILLRLISGRKPID